MRPEQIRDCWNTLSQSYAFREVGSLFQGFLTMSSDVFAIQLLALPSLLSKSGSNPQETAGYGLSASVLNGVLLLGSVPLLIQSNTIRRHLSEIQPNEPESAHKQAVAISILLRNMLLYTTLASASVITFFYQMDSIFSALKQDPVVSSIASDVLKSYGSMVAPFIFLIMTMAPFIVAAKAKYPQLLALGINALSLLTAALLPAHAFGRLSRHFAFSEVILPFAIQSCLIAIAYTVSVHRTRVFRGLPIFSELLKNITADFCSFLRFISNAALPMLQSATDWLSPAVMLVLYGQSGNTTAQAAYSLIYAALILNSLISVFYGLTMSLDITHQRTRFFADIKNVDQEEAKTELTIFRKSLLSHTIGIGVFGSLIPCLIMAAPDLLRKVAGSTDLHTEAMMNEMRFPLALYSFSDFVSKILCIYFGRGFDRLTQAVLIRVAQVALLFTVSAMTCYLGNAKPDQISWAAFSSLTAGTIGIAFWIYRVFQNCTYQMQEEINNRFGAPSVISIPAAVDEPRTPNHDSSLNSPHRLFRSSSNSNLPAVNEPLGDNAPFGHDSTIPSRLT